jgi:hypothetical protein
MTCGIARLLAIQWTKLLLLLLLHGDRFHCPFSSAQFCVKKVSP